MRAWAAPRSSRYSLIASSLGSGAYQTCQVERDGPARGRDLDLDPDLDRDRDPDPDPDLD
jgi:hypothetical protein